jgi:hypothetical protein
VKRRSERTVYGTRAMTSKKLAEKLQVRCLDELQGGILPARGFASASESFYVGPVTEDAFGATPASRAAIAGKTYYFAVQKLSRPTSSVVWRALVIVTPQLDVLIEDPEGPVERAVLACALKKDR